MVPDDEGAFLLPLFPLPNLVFFPQTSLPLHIFEPRYRQMVKDALDGDQRFGIVLLESGWESDYHGAPAVHACGTIARIEQSLPLDDGRFNIIVRGEVRFRILEEVSRVPYRTARVVVAPEQEGDPVIAAERKDWLAGMARRYMRYLPDQSAVPEIESAGLASLTNALIMALHLDTEEKQKLLENDLVIDRAAEVGHEMTQRIETLEFLAPFRRPAGDPSHN